MRPLQNLKNSQLLEELLARDAQLKRIKISSKKDLENHLKAMMGEIIRTPAMSFNNEFKTMEELGLKNYEVVPIEPLHDIK